MSLDMIRDKEETDKRNTWLLDILPLLTEDLGKIDDQITRSSCDQIKGYSTDWNKKRFSRLFVNTTYSFRSSLRSITDETTRETMRVLLARNSSV